MTLRLHPVCAFFLTAISACSSFTGREADASVAADMNVAADAGVDAGDGAVEPDAGTLPTIVVPAV